MNLFLLTAMAATIHHHSCELWVPKWEVHGSGSKKENLELKKILTAKNYKKIRFTIHGPSNNADHLLLTYSSDAAVQERDEGIAKLNFEIHDYSSNTDIKMNEFAECAFMLESTERYEYIYEKTCPGKMLKLAASLPECVITSGGTTQSE